MAMAGTEAWKCQVKQHENQGLEPRRLGFFPGNTESPLYLSSYKPKCNQITLVGHVTEMTCITWQTYLNS